MAISSLVHYAISYCVFQNSCRGHTIHTFIRILVHAIWRFIVRCQSWFLFWFELFIYVLLYIFLFVLHEVICWNTWNGNFLSGLPGHIPIVWHGRRVVCRGLVCVVRPTAQPPISMVYRILMVVQKFKIEGRTFTPERHHSEILRHLWDNSEMMWEMHCHCFFKWLMICNIFSQIPVLTA